MVSIVLEECAFTPPEIIQTTGGPFILRKGTTTPRFEELFRKHRNELVSQGFIQSNMFGGGVIWWRPAPQIDDPLAQGETDTDFQPPVPEGMELKPFQRAGVEHLWKRWKERKQGAIVADEMGLGKSCQAIAFVNTIEASNVLLVCPASLKINWVREIDMWSTQDLSVAVLDGRKAEVPASGYVIVNYDIVRSLQSKLRKVEWDVIVCDEAHMLANPAAGRTGALIGPRAGTEGVSTKFWVMLTGTPMPNRPIELQSMLRKVEPEVFSNRSQYANRFCDFEACGNNLGASNLGELRELLRPIMIRRLKAQVMKDLPARTFRLIPLPPTSEMEMVLDREQQAFGLSAKAKADIEERIASATSEADLSQALSSLRPKDVKLQGHLMAERAALGVAKVDSMVREIRETMKTEDKVVVMVNHREVVEMLARNIPDLNPVFLHGGVTKKRRQEAVDRFQQDPDCRAFVGTIRAAGVGLTLTAAATMIFGELDWTPAWVQQAADRCHRIGQVRPVTVKILAVEGSIDQIMASLLIRKASIAHEVLDSRKRRERSASPARIGETSSRQVQRHEVKRLVWAGRRLMNQSNRANGQGFSRFDMPKARFLLGKEDPSDLEIQELSRILRKYRRQLRPDEVEIVGA